LRGRTVKRNTGQRSLRSIEYVSSFIQQIRRNLAPGNLDIASHFWFQRKDKGLLVLDQDEEIAYRDVIQRLCEDFVKKDDLSRRTVEQYLQDAVLDALDIPDTSAKTFDQRLRHATQDLLQQLTAGRLRYDCFVPVTGLIVKDLPVSVGRVRFVAFGGAQLRRLSRGVGKRAGSRPFRQLVASLKKEPFLWGRPCAVVQVEARDSESALLRATLATGAAVDTLNFLADLVPYNYGAVRLLRDERQGLEVGVVLSSDRRLSVPHTRAERTLPYALENLRKHAPTTKLLKLLSRLSTSAKHGTAGSALVAAVMWAGRASVEERRELGFLLFAIALEAAVLSDGDQRELTYRLGLRVARLLGRNPEQRERLRSDVTRLYAIRSKIVHAGSYEVTDEHLGRLRSLALRTLIRLLRRRKVWHMKTKDFGAWLERLVAR
jgi:hypothetical protein